MAVRRKRSISIPPDLDSQIQAEAARDEMTYSAWLAGAAHRELTIRAGLRAVAEVEQQLGAFTEEERADAERWAKGAIERSRRSGSRARRAA